MKTFGLNLIHQINRIPSFINVMYIHNKIRKKTMTMTKTGRDSKRWLGVAFAAVIMLCSCSDKEVPPIRAKTCLPSL